MRRSTPAWAAGKVRATILTQSAPCPRCPRSQPGLASPSPLSKLNCSCLALSRDSLWPEVNRRPHSRCGWSIRPGWAVGAGADTRTSWPGARGTCLRNPRAVTGKRKRLRGPMFFLVPSSARTRLRRRRQRLCGLAAQPPPAGSRLFKQASAFRRISARLACCCLNGCAAWRWLQFLGRAQVRWCSPAVFFFFCPPRPCSA